jgi:hypothetical protein
MPMSLHRLPRRSFWFRCWLLLAATAGLQVGCHSFRLLGPILDRSDKAEKEQQVALPSKCRFRYKNSPYVFYADFELKRDLPLFRELAELRDQVYKELQLPDSTTMVHVYLFEDRERYERFMKGRYPDLPKRRAFFVAQPRGVSGSPEDLMVYTYWGDRIQQDLRHELTHALLHSVLLDVPLWLDEGLAEFFELPPDWKGVNYQHLSHLRRTSGEPFKPDLVRLERLSQVQQMTPAEYREAWAWVHLMLRGKPEAKAVLLGYVQQLRHTREPGPLQPRLAAVFPSPDEALEKHLAQLESSVRKGPTVQRVEFLRREN